ncbi:MAG: hypothetical protein JO122_19390 [Acetobacteraceae bacterium]|nr:hypothetical protein [Acetobacteraceae bacterium]
MAARAPVTVEQFRGVAAVQWGELLGEGGVFFFGGLGCQDAVIGKHPDAGA